MSETPPSGTAPSEAAPDASPTRRRPGRLHDLPLLTMALNLALIATIFATRKRWSAWVEDAGLGEVLSCLVAASGRRIAVPRDDGFAVWDVEEGREIARLPAPEPPALAPSRREPQKGSDGATTAAGTDAGFFAGGARFLVMRCIEPEREEDPVVWGAPVVFDAGSGEKLFELDAGARPDVSASLSRGDRVFVPYGDGTNRVWNGATGELVADLRPSYRLRGGACFSHDGARLVTLGEDGTARLWDADSGRELHAFGGPGLLSTATFACGGSRIIVTREVSGGVSAEGVCDIFDAETGERVARLEVGECGRFVTPISPDGRALAGCRRGEVFVADAGTGAVLRRIEAGHPVGSLRFSRSGGFLFGHDAGDSGDHLSVWNVGTGECFYSGSPRILAGFAPDEKRFFRALGPFGASEGVEVRSAASGSVLARIPAVQTVQLLNDDAAVFWCEDMHARLCRRIRPEQWWGVLWLPHFWVIVILAVALVLSGWRDLRRLRCAS